MCGTKLKFINFKSEHLVLENISAKAVVQRIL